MRHSTTLLIAASFVVVVSAGCTAGGGYSGVYASGTVVGGTPVYGYPGWLGFETYGLAPYPGPYFGAPHQFPRFGRPGFRSLPPQFRSGPRWGGPRHYHR